ncbi:MAG: tetratricopeptide repeat protein [Gallionella sp.]|jgi:tetratricopeptide (TPR) repeat protein|nr:tetratricopeptide repeat protein [Gallionella sp.]MCK9355321.1 tetratricopeptide repeat protein [Gallionella sp.]
MTSFDITHFNSGTQNEADFLRNFIARHDVLQFFLAQLRNTQTGQAARHHLVVAPRGYGKTSLLRRIKIALRDEPEFNQRYIPLSFREEQHNVISLDVFWRNCLQSLLEAREDEHADPAEIEALDQLWQKHAPRNNLKREEQDGAPAYSALTEHCRKLGRRPVLLIDNLDSLLAGLEQHQWGLRTELQKADGPVLIAAASRHPEPLRDEKAAFFDFFRLTTLSPLSDHDVMSCLSELARMRGDRGIPVRQMLENDPGRISALNTMAGGNPRTLGVLYTVLEAHMSDDVLAQLSAMLDTFTGWYQARTEELPLQSRAVFDALALNWDPMTAADIGKITGLDTPTVSSHLSRLEKSGYVETVSLSRTKKSRNGYQVSERFFNIWYLMRNGPRRTRQAIKFLTIFLRSCFSRQELHAMAKDKLQNGVGRVESTLALAASIGDSRLRGRLLDTAELSLIKLERTDEMRALLNEMRKENESNKRSRTTDTANQLIKLLEKAEQHISNHQFELAENILIQLIEINEEWAAPWGLLGDLQQYNLKNYEGAEASYRKAIALDQKNAGPWGALGDLLQDHLKRYEEAEFAYRQAIALDKKWANPWGRLGELLQDHLARYEEAEAAYRKAIALDGKHFGPWGRLGSLLHYKLKRYEEAETAYRKAIALNERLSVIWGMLGDLLQYRLKRYEEAETAYHQAIALDKKDWRPFGALGDLLCRLKRHEEAEVAYRQAIALDGKKGRPWGELGDLLQYHLGRYEEAEVAYRKAIALDKKNAHPWGALGDLLQDHLNRYEEAEVAYRQAIALNEKWDAPWGALARLLQNRLARHEEAEIAYRKAISLDKKNYRPWIALGDLLHLHFERYVEAEAAYRQGISLGEKNHLVWNNLGNLLQDYLGRDEEALDAYQQGLAIDPQDGLLLANIAYLYALHLGQHTLASNYAQQAKSDLSPAGQHLLDSMLTWSNGGADAANRGWSELHLAISCEDEALWSDYIDDLQRILAYATARGDDETVRKHMIAADYPMQYAPLYHAYCAILDGEDHLLGVNPEVRGMAENIYRGMARMVKLFKRPASSVERKSNRAKRTAQP